ncbi:MAG: hypothetical protein LUF80_00665, partial [Oscillospiraceae bacterium]|nr:hypothetical protein [Oscillospiraceae bacterium]
MAVTLDFNKLREMNDSLQKKNEDEEKTTYKKVNGNVVTGTQVSLDFDRLRDMNESLQSARKIRETLAAKRADAEAKAGVTQKSTGSSASSAQSILPTSAVSKLFGNSKTGTTVYTPGGTSKKATATPMKSDEADSLLPSSASQTALSTMADRQSAAQSVLDAAKLSQDTAAKGVDTAKLAVDTSDAGALRRRIESLQKEANRLTEAANEAGSSLGTPLAQRQSQSKKLSGAAAEIQAQIDQLDSQYKTMTGKTAQDVNFSDWLGGVVDTGLNQFNQSVASTLDFVLPTELLLGEDNDPISKLNEYYSNKKDTAESDLSATSAAMGKGWGTAGSLSAGVVGSTPNMIASLLTGGLSAAGSLGPAASGLASTIMTGIQTLIKNPSFWVSIAQTTGPAYDEAKATGSSELEATAAGLITGLTNSIVEMGGGLETLPSSLQSGSKSAIREWVSSMLDEGKEEVIQGVIENLTAKTVYDKDRAWFSTEDTDAVINPVRALQEFGGGALAGGILGGVQAGVVNAVNSNTNTDAETDFYSGLGSRFSNLGDESIQSIVNSGLESGTNTESYQYAQQAQNILDRGGTLTDEQLGRLYAANVEAVNTETGAQNTLEAQEETPAGRTLTAPLAAPVTAREIIQDLTAQGVDTQTAQSLGETIAAITGGETISGNRAARIAQNEQALNELETLTGTTINTDAPLSQVKMAIQNAGIQAQSGAETAQTGLTSQDTLEPIQTAQGASQAETGARIDALVRGETNGQFAQTNTQSAQANTQTSQTAQANTQSTQTKKADVSALGVNAGQAGIYLRTSGLSEQAVQAAADSYDGNMETQADYLSEFVQVYTAAKSGQTL